MSWLFDGLSLVLVVAGVNLLAVAGVHGQDDDYWAEGYDEEQNCVSKDLIEETMHNAKKQCVANTMANSSEALDYCKKELSTYLFAACSHTRPEKPGELLYCIDRSTTTCCFHNYTCVNTWNDIGRTHEQKAVDFMKEPEKYLEAYRKDLYFNTCHYLKDSYDATACAEDCKALEANSTLATDCETKGGLFKCCIRRDKVSCHECRYCCTLPFCTYQGEKDVQFYGEESLEYAQELGNQENKITAIQALEVMNPFWKSEDTRCLKPYSDPDPNKWGHYDPDIFPYITNKEVLDKVKPVEYDKRFFNFEDPEVFKMMTGKNFEQNWKEAYGFDFVAQVQNNKSESVMIECSKNCLEAEKTKFAKDCHKDKGLFKCCINTLGLFTFLHERLTLKKEGLISTEVSDICGKNGKKKECSVCAATYSCTKKNIYTGNIEQVYLSPEVNRLGGKILLESGGGLKNERFGFRNSYCLKQDYCSVSESMYDFASFSRATTPAEICKLATDVIDENHVEGSKQAKKLESIQMGEKPCETRISNVRICPKKVLKVKHKHKTYFF